VVTGVTRGLGRAMLDRFHELDWMVAGCGRSVEAVEELRRQFGEAHHFSVVDVADQQEVGGGSGPAPWIPRRIEGRLLVPELTRLSRQPFPL